MSGTDPSAPRLTRIPRGRRIALSPPAVLAMLYAVAVALGAGGLKLPAMTAEPISWSDAIFTATSAITITGLIVVDTGAAFSTMGHVLLLVLIQLGGLGIMVFAVLVLAALGLPIGMSHRMFLRDDLNQTSITDLLTLVRTVLGFMLVCEAAGFVLLATVFVPEFGWSGGLWQALFHSVSAFNNAGFALFPDSLSRWVANPTVNLVVPTLYILGGLGFSTVAELLHERRWRTLSLHSKLMLSGTALLTLWAVATFAALEWTNGATLGALDGTWPRLMASWFQGTATRSSGFNTVPIDETHDSTALLSMVMMIIGGGPTSTAGGIKVTTFAVLVLATVAFFRRQERPHAFGRSLGDEEVRKVLALAVVSVFAVLMGLFMVTLSRNGAFIDLAFEVTSAFGTVGLSRGMTDEVDDLGRTVLIVLMFLGRVGPLTLGFFLATRIRPLVRYPSGQVFLG